MIQKHGTPSCSYDLDPSYCVTSVDEGFELFAVSNGAPELLPPACLGRSVMHSIADPTTKNIYRLLFDRVIRDRRPAVFPIRCDSPTERRFLELWIETAPGGLRVSTFLLRAEPRALQDFLNLKRPAEGPAVRMCSWCGRVAMADAWVEVEEALIGLNLFARPTLPPITHGMCDRCFAAIDAHLRRSGS